MKGVLLGGGSGSRLAPTTWAVNKHLLPVYDKPLIYYPLATLMLAGIRDIAVVTDEQSTEAYNHLLTDGTHLGVHIEFVIQSEPAGIPHGLSLCDDWADGSPVALILGDNVFHGPGLGSSLATIDCSHRATVLAYQVQNPENYAVLDFEDSMSLSPRRIMEKPPKPPSNWVVPGVYFLPADCFDIAGSLSPSPRGETEIAELLQVLLDTGRLDVRRLPRGSVWMDAGTVPALNDVSNYVRLLQERQGVQVACLEEIAFSSGWIGPAEVRDRANALPGTAYGSYLHTLLEQVGREN